MHLNIAFFSTFDSHQQASAYQDIAIGQMVASAGGGSAHKARVVSANKSAEFIASMLVDCGNKAFLFAARESERRNQKIDLDAIESDMWDRAATQHAKRFVEGETHSAFLQENRKLGRVSTAVINPSTNEKIDTRTFGNSRARHRTNTNRLEAVPKVKPPPLYPCGRKKPKSGEGMGSLFASAVTPPSKSVYPALKTASSDAEGSEDDMMFVGSRDDVIDDMLTRVTRRAFDQTGVFQSVVNVDSGEVEKSCEVSKGSISLYKNICSKREIARDVIGETISRREVSSSIECLDIVKPFVDDAN